MKYFRWTQNGFSDNPNKQDVWYIEEILLHNIDQWSLKSGQFIDNWDVNTTAYFSGKASYTDFPFSAFDIPIYSSKLKLLMEALGLKNIQYLPIKVVNRDSNQTIAGFCIANYLKVIDCLNRDLSVYEVWTKENLLFWEDRPWMLGAFRDVSRLVIDASKIGEDALFRLKGWEVATIVREDIKQAIEEASITGCIFSEIEASYDRR